ncbi:acetate kinase, partial [Clavibacter nebraskensis]
MPSAPAPAPAPAPAASVLVLNAGSSSLKHRLVDPVTGAARASGTVERIGEPGGDAPDHESAVRIALDRV